MQRNTVTPPKGAVSTNKPKPKGATNCKASPATIKFSALTYGLCTVDDVYWKL